MIGFCHWISGREVHPLSVELPYPVPADPAPYRDAFACRLSFNAAGSSLLFADADLKMPLPTSNPALAELHDRFAGEYLRRFDHSQTSYRAREVIIRRLPDGEPRRDQVACELCMSERTLQRRLEAEFDLLRRAAGQHTPRARRAVSQSAPPLARASSFPARLRRPEQLLPRLQTLVRALARAVPQPVARAPDGSSRQLELTLDGGPRVRIPVPFKAVIGWSAL